MNHISTCAMGEVRECPAPKGQLHSEPLHSHWWSGWPGAHCLKCGDEDKMEVCMGDGCKCPCHDAFWKAYDEAMKKADFYADDLGEF